MTSLPIDVRAQTFCDLGPVISGQLSDDPIQPGVGLLRTQGEIVISGLIQPARGSEIKLGVKLPDGKLTRFPRRLRVLKADSDPNENQTTLTIGCLLALKWNLVKSELYHASDHPQWAIKTTSAGSTPNVIFVGSMMGLCLDRCGIIQASGNPTVNWANALETHDLSGGYLEVVSQILGEAGMYGFINAEEKLRIRKVLDPIAKGPRLTMQDLITMEAIGDPPPPSTLKIKQTNGAFSSHSNGSQYSANYQPRWYQDDTGYPWNEQPPTTPPQDPPDDSPRYPLGNWTFQETISPAESYIVDYRVKQGNQYITKTDQISHASTATVVTEYAPISYLDQDGKNQTQDVVVSTISTTTTCVGAANPTRWKSKLEAGSSAFPGAELTKRTETFNRYVITEEGPVEREIVTYEYEPKISFAGGLAIENYKNIDLGTGNVLVRKTIVEKEENKAADLTMQITTVFQAWGATSAGKTAASVIMTGLKNAKDADRISGTYALVDRMTALVSNGPEKVINVGRGTAPAQPTKLDIQNYRLKNIPRILDINGAWDQTPPSDDPQGNQSIDLTFGNGQDSSNGVYEMKYTPDSYVIPAAVGGGDNGTGITFVYNSASAAVYSYGKVVNAILSGMAYGKTITTEFRNLPSEPMGTLYIEAAGTVGRFRANGSTFAFDSQGLIAGCDAMLDGGAGLVANASGADWFPMMVPAANLPTVTPVANRVPALANSIAAPNGFDPGAPGAIWGSFGTAGVEGDVYASELTVANVIGQVVETVRRESVSRSLTWLLQAPYNTTPVTINLVSVARSIGEFGVLLRQNLYVGSGGGSIETRSASTSPGGMMIGSGSGAIVDHAAKVKPKDSFVGSGSGVITTSTKPVLWVPTALDLWYEKPTSGATWVERSHGRDLVQTAATQQPVLSATPSDGLNGIPVLTFDGSNDVMLCADAGANGVQNVSMFMVVRYNSPAIDEDVVAGIGSYGAIRAAYRNAVINGPSQSFATWGNDAHGNLNCDIGGSFHIWSFVQNGAYVTIDRDGVTETIQMQYPSVATVSSPCAFLGGIASDNNTYASNISIVAWLTEYRAVGTSDQQRYQGYLADQYWRQQGVGVPLVNTHPYYSAAPTVS